MDNRNNISYMHPDLLDKYKLFQNKMKKAKLLFALTSVARTVQEQFALYSQGRNPITVVNKYRTLAHMEPILVANNKIVTWTLNSKHLINIDNDRIDDDKSRAFDIVLYDKTQKKITWDLKVNVNENSIGDWREAALIGRSIGLRAGAFF